jgi:hypothetical protein
MLGYLHAKGPQGPKRPADVIGNAVHVMRIATGEVEETVVQKDPPRSLWGSAAVLRVARLALRKLSSRERSLHVKKAAKARWTKP